MYCICCQKNSVTPYMPDAVTQSINGTDSSEEDLLWKERKCIDNTIIKGGIIQTMLAGYGSMFDGECIILAICDKCIKEKLRDATILYYESIDTKSIDKSKYLYRRRSRLDSLL